ncbi:MAG: hypothetical protein EAS52_04575 [Parapedobacter sp.]|nr:MAG: hypothetical protein EAS52_04575 [Parapedobacter sp.]
MSPFIVWLSMILAGINTSQLFAQTPEDKTDFKAIDAYIVEKMRLPHRSNEPWKISGCPHSFAGGN